VLAAVNARELFYRYVNPTHFMIEAIGLFGGIRAGVPARWAVTLSVAGWVAHEWLDGDLRRPYLGINPLGVLPYPWEGVKDVVWGLTPLLALLW